MKPQSLQDAIRVQALRKEKVRQNGGWKEPFVKQYQVTADDLVKSPKRVLTPIEGFTVHPFPAVNSQELLGMKKMMEEMSLELKRQRADITELQNENRTLRVALCSQLSNGGNSYLSSPSSSPVSPKKAKPPASMEPHDPQVLSDHQRKDKALRHFMTTKEGLYESKYMSILEIKGGNIICFKKKIYIPQSLRRMTIQHYKKDHPTDSAALEALRKNCCWPDLEKDFYCHNQ